MFSLEWIVVGYVFTCIPVSSDKQYKLGVSGRSSDLNNLMSFLHPTNEYPFPTPWSPCIFLKCHSGLRDEAVSAVDWLYLANSDGHLHLQICWDTRGDIN